ncbi:MAG: hypothetical protein LBH19_01575 [Dysgonamonadaceae bacterium]|nr:hypothetical protein [Dysgonamonadaceae bacterium]
MQQLSKTQSCAVYGDSAREQRPLQKRGESENPIVKSRMCFMLLAAMLFLFSAASVSAQNQSTKTQIAKPDVITLLTGDDIDAVVQKVGDTDIEYKKWSNKNGPTYTLKKSEIFRICYANGEKDVFFKIEEQNVQQQKNTTQSTNASQQTDKAVQSNMTLPLVVATDIPGLQQGACYSALFAEMKTKGFNVQSEDYATQKGFKDTEGIDADKFLKNHSKNVTPDDKYIVLLVTMKSFFNASWTFRTFDMSTGKMLVEESTSTSISRYANFGDLTREALNYFLAKHPTLVE